MSKRRDDLRVIRLGLVRLTLFFFFLILQTKDMVSGDAKATAAAQAKGRQKLAKQKKAKSTKGVQRRCGA